MSNIQLANANTNSNAIAPPHSDELKRRVRDWIDQPATYTESAAATFAQSIQSFALDDILSIRTQVNILATQREKAVEAQYRAELASLSLKPELIGQSLGQGALGGLSSAFVATQVTTALAMASCATPAGLIGGSGIAVVYYNIKKLDLQDRAQQNMNASTAKTQAVVHSLLSKLSEQRRILDVQEKDRAITALEQDKECMRSRIDELDRSQESTKFQLKENAAETELLKQSVSAAEDRYDNLEREGRIANENLGKLSSELEENKLKNEELERDSITARREIRSFKQERDTAICKLGEVSEELRALKEDIPKQIRETSRELKAELRREFEEQKALQAKDFETKFTGQRNRIENLRQELNRALTVNEVLQAELDEKEHELSEKSGDGNNASATADGKSIRESLRFSNEPTSSSSYLDNEIDYCKIEKAN